MGLVDLADELCQAALGVPLVVLERNQGRLVVLCLGHVEGVDDGLVLGVPGLLNVAAERLAVEAQNRVGGHLE